MKKTLAALAAAAILAVAVAAPSDAQAQRRWVGPLIGGLAAGAIIGGALAAPRPRYYYDEPVYVAPRPVGCVERQWVWSERRGDYVSRNVRVPC